MRHIAAVRRVAVGPSSGLSCVKHRRHSRRLVFRLRPQLPLKVLPCDLVCGVIIRKTGSLTFENAYVGLLSINSTECAHSYPRAHVSYATSQPHAVLQRELSLCFQLYHHRTDRKKLRHLFVFYLMLLGMMLDAAPLYPVQTSNYSG